MTLVESTGAVTQMPATRRQKSGPTDPTGMLMLIGRLAADPTTDVEKIKELIAIQERMAAAHAKKVFTEAFNDMQDELPAIKRNGMIVVADKNNPNKIIQQTPYAKWEDIHRIVTPILKRHGFQLFFRTRSETDGRLTVITILRHIDGHEETSEYTLPLDTSGSKNNVQGVGSSSSYGKRYGTVNLLNLRTEGEDDDGAAGGGEPDAPATISQAQIETIQKLIVETGSDIPKFCEFMGVEKIPSITPQAYPKAIHALETKRSKA